MKIAKNILLGALVVLAEMSAGQDALYKVFYFDGDIRIRALSAKEWTGLERLNIHLNEKDSLRLEQGSFIYLMDHRGRQVYLDRPGKYEVTELAGNPQDNSLSLFARYAEFIWEELGKDEQDIDDYADRTLKEKGGVSRAINIPPIIMPFYGSYEMAEEIVFCWEDSGAEEYVVTFWDSDQEGKWLASFTTADTFLTVHSSLDWIPRDVYFYFTLTEKNRPSVNFIPIRVLGPGEQERLLDELENISRMKAHEQVKLLMTASMYEENKLYSEADKTYRRALELSPGNEQVLEYYQLFRERRGWRRE